jgi:sulfatase modifying factor 1
MRAVFFLPALVGGAAWLAAGCGADTTSGADGGGQGGGGYGTGGAGGTGGSIVTSGSAGSGGGGTGGAETGGGGTGGMMGEPCEVGGKPGTCIDVADCTGDYAPTPGYCPGPANIQCCTELTPGACDENAKPQPNAGLVEPPGEGGCPSGMLPIADFCIDRYEASLVYADDDSPFSPYFNPGIENVRAVSIAEAVPQGYISGIEAEDACTMSGKRLCTDDEWRRACRGPANTVYPYGDTLILGACNDHRAVHPAVEYFGTTDDWIYSKLGNPCLNQLPASLDPTGTNPECMTAEGAYDMMGNLHEWTADPAGTFRGGFYVDTKLNGPGCLYATTAHPTSHWDYSTGFRCCADP